jgi:hypothetical protein
MRGIALTWIIIVSPLAASARSTETAEPEGIDRLLDAIATVESRNNSWAIGDGGEALGVYQIHQAYWVDGTKFLGVNWSYAEATNPAKAREVVRAYLLHYGRGCSLLELARIHNGGPTGRRKPDTLGYARKIARIIGADCTNS